MAKMIFVNLPVKDLKASVAHYGKMGFENNPNFSDETAACMVLSESIYVMLLTHPKFKEFTPNQLADAQKTTQVINALNCESKDEVIAKIKTALASGGKRYAEPKDMGFMYQDGYQDLDGHIWEYFFMDPAAVPG